MRDVNPRIIKGVFFDLKFMFLIIPEICELPIRDSNPNIHLQRVTSYH
jgi:hypothetical protein